jgi:hypothetical protein
MDDTDLESRARRRVKRKLGFYTHALVYFVVNAGLIALNLLGGFSSGDGHVVAWSAFPLVGWGIGLSIHGIVTFLSLQGDGLKQTMLAREIEALKRREGR